MPSIKNNNRRNSGEGVFDPNFGFHGKDNVSLTVTWPSGKRTQLENVVVNKTLTLSEKDAELVSKDQRLIEKNIFVFFSFCFETSL